MLDMDAELKIWNRRRAGRAVTPPPQSVRARPPSITARRYLIAWRAQYVLRPR
jgi:hypothetical protein